MGDKRRTTVAVDEVEKALTQGSRKWAKIIGFGSFLILLGLLWNQWGNTFADRASAVFLAACGAYVAGKMAWLYHEAETAFYLWLPVLAGTWMFLVAETWWEKAVSVFLFCSYVAWCQVRESSTSNNSHQKGA